MYRTSYFRILKAAMCLAALATIATTLGAQERCAATYRELGTRTPRGRLHEESDSLRRVRPLVVDGTGCGRWGAPALASLGTSDSSYRAGASLRILAPTARVDFAGGLPMAGGTGGAWAGRGTNLFARIGVATDLRRFHIVLAPEFWTAENRAFDLFSSPDPSRSSFASPWYGAPYSLDLPSRMGIDRLTEITPGQSSAWVRAGPVELGISTSSQQWGPGRHGGLVLGSDAPGIPRLFARTAEPVVTRAGAWSFSAFSGTVNESRYFDRDEANDRRSLAGFTAIWSPAVGSALSIGVAHATMRGRTWRQEMGAAPTVSDQVTSGFAQLGGNGSRVYGEVAHAGALPDVNDFLRVPYAGLAYVVGVEQALERRGGTLLLSAEAANLEQPTDVRGDSAFDFYSSRRIPQGWTHRGRVLGYPTGPGSMHAAIAIDWVAPGWSVGIFGARTRWNEDAFHRQYLANAVRHDVSLRAGILAGYVSGGYEFTVALSGGKRLNYLFQNSRFNPDYRTLDVPIPQLRIAVTPLRAGPR